MPKQLTATFVRTVNTPGKYHDEHGLILRVVLSERKRWVSKSWIQRLVIHGRRRDLGLGAYPLVGLADACERALGNRRIARSGGDLRARPAAAAPIFEAVLSGKAPAAGEKRSCGSATATARPGVSHRDCGAYE